MPEDEAPRAARSDAEILGQARERLKRCIEAGAEERARQRDDLLFSILEQWPGAIRAERENDPNGARPCLTIDHINQYIVQVVNDMRQNRPAVKARPVDEGADIETAQIFQGLIRQIEDQSSAHIAYATAAESAVRVGEGYFRIVTEYEDDQSFNQVIRIRRVPDMFSVYLGHHLMPEGSDAPYGFVFEDLLLEDFRARWPRAKYHSTEFSELDRGQEFWAQEGKIRVAEYFYFEQAPVELVFTAEGRALARAEYEALEEAPEIVDSRPSRRRALKWCKLTGVEILEKRDWAGRYIPIVKMIGKEAWIDGRRCLWGLVRPAKDSLRMYNYWASTITEKIALSPKAPFIGAKGQFEGLEDRWSQANRVNYPYLEYHPVSVDGLSVPPPQRQAPAPLEVAMIQQLQTIREDVQASLGMFKASLGREQPNQSGRAILALTRESDTGTFHFSDNQSISIQHGGRILVDLIPRIYDTARVLKILGEDGKIASAQIDPEQGAAHRDIVEAGGKIRKIYNLGVGTYDVTVTVGPSYNTKRMEAAQLFTELGNTAKDPASAAVMRYLAVKNSDVPGADQGAEMLEKLLPPGLVKQEGQSQIAPEVMMKMQQMGQALQQLGQQNQELKAGLEEAMARVNADHHAKMAQLSLDEKVEIEKARVEKDMAQRELELKQWRAKEELRIEEMTAQRKAELNCDVDITEAIGKIKNLALAHETRMRGMLDAEGAQRDRARAEIEVNNGEQALIAMHSQLLQGVQQIVSELSAKKRINVIRKDGWIVGADVTAAE